MLTDTVLALRALDIDTMARVLAILSQAEPNMRSRLDWLWVRKGFRYAVLLLWVLSASSNFIIPSCGRNNSVSTTRDTDAVPVKSKKSLMKSRLSILV